ncbi:unnamed protein product [Discula destructiva]
MSATSTISFEVYLGVCIPLIVITGCVLSIRCWMALRQQGRLRADDYLSIAGLALITTTFAMNRWIFEAYVTPGVATMEWLDHMALTITIVVGFALWACKAPILLLYINLFTVQSWLLYWCYGTLAISGMWYILAMSPTFRDCPSSGPVDVATLLQCSQATKLTGVVSGVNALLSDILIFILPLPIIAKLHMPRAKKLAVSTVFLSGIFGIVASILSLYYKVLAWHGDQTQVLTTMFCLIIECTIALMVGSAPATKGFWSQIVRGKRLATRATASYASARITPASKRSNQASENDTYVLLEAGYQTGKLGFASGDHVARTHYGNSASIGTGITYPSAVR